MPGNANIIGSEGFRPNIDLAKYYPKEKEVKQQLFQDVLNDNADIDRFTKNEGSQLQKDIKKTVKGIQEMVLAYVKGRVPLGDDKFNTTDMLRSMLDMLNATGNMQQAAMQEDSNKMALQQLCILMSQQVGREALIKDNRLDFKGKPINIAVDVPGEGGTVLVAIEDATGRIIRSFEMNEQPGIQYVQWDGLDDEGEVAKVDTYMIQAAIQDEEGKTMPVSLYVPRKIEELRFDSTKHGRFPVYYSGNAPIKNMLSVYSGTDAQVNVSQTDEAV
jgi:hypothetical protein